MNLLLKYCAVILISCGFWACSTDFDVAADWEEVTIIYGLLDSGEPINYVKINKAFLSENTSALEVAAIPDSLYYEGTLNARLLAYDEFNGIQDEVELSLVTAAEEGIVKEEGLFANQPYFLYKITDALNPAWEYEIIVTTEAGTVTSSRTEVLGDITISQPNTLIEISLLGENINTAWDYNALAPVHDMDIYFNFFEERLMPNGSIENNFRSIKWDIFKNLVANNNRDGLRVEYQIKVEQLFNFLLQNLSTSDSIEQRYFQSMDFVLHSATEDFYRFNLVASAQLGLTSSNNTLEYTNIENGLGIFASRYTKVVDNVKLRPQSIDLLACQALTSELKFAVSEGTPTFPDCQ